MSTTEDRRWEQRAQLARNCGALPILPAPRETQEVILRKYHEMADQAEARLREERQARGRTR